MRERVTNVNPRVLIKGLLVLIGLVVLGYALKASGFGDLLTTDWIDARIKGQGLSGEVLFIVISAASTAVGLPRQMIAFLAGYAFGFAMGTALSVLAAALGCALTFLFARLIARDFVARRLKGRFARADAFLSRNTLSTTIAIRLLPVGSNVLLNLAAGAASVSFWRFVLASAIGYIPQMMIFALVGSGINVEPEIRISAGVALFIIAGLIGVRLYKKHRRDIHLDRDIDAEIDAALQGDLPPKKDKAP